MERDVSRLLLRVVAAAGAVVAGASSSDCKSSQPTGDPPDAATVCPATPEDTIGRACAVEGMQCAPEYTCGETQAAVYCTCTGGVFKCTDGHLDELDAGDVPSCPPRGGRVVCPATEATASGAGCSEQGAQCAYPAKCDGGVPEYDTCYCFTGQTLGGTMGLRWECSNTCGSAGAPGDGGADAGTAPADAGGSDARGLDAATE